MKSFFNLGILSVLVLALSGCGASTAKDKKVEIFDTGTLSNGKYSLGSATIEYFGTDGSRLNTVTLQVTGQYFWSMAAQGEGKYELTATGNAKLLTNNQLVGEFICSGSRDVAHFELSDSNAVSNFRLTEAGCPQGISLQGATQLSIESLSANTFVFTIVEIADGYRAVATYTFNKR